MLRFQYLTIIRYRKNELQDEEIKHEAADQMSERFVCYYFVCLFVLMFVVRYVNCCCLVGE